MAQLVICLNEKDLVEFQSAINNSEVSSYIEALAKSYISTSTGNTIRLQSWEFVNNSPTNLKIKINIV